MPPVYSPLELRTLPNELLVIIMTGPYLQCPPGDKTLHILGVNAESMIKHLECFLPLPRLEGRHSGCYTAWRGSIHKMIHSQIVILFMKCSVEE